MIKTKDMTSGDIYKLVIPFAFSLLLANVGQQFYLIVDASIVGRGIGVRALAAVGCADWCYWLIMWSVMGLAHAFGFFVSRYFGRQNYKMMNKVIANSVILCFIVGCFFTITGLLVTRPLLVLLGTPEDILSDATVYLMTMIAGTLIVTAYNMSSAILMAFGNGKEPLIAIVIAGITNILLDLLFVLVFRLGIFGAAVASVIAQLMSFLFCLNRISHIKEVIITKEDWKCDVRLCSELLRFGFPIVLEYIVICLSGIVLQSTVNSQGSAFVAGFTATNKLYGIMECSAVSLGTAFATFFSQNYGAKNYDRLREGVKKGIVLAVVMSVLVPGLIIPSGRFLLRIFIDVKKDGGVETLEIAYRYLFYMAVSMIIIYSMYIYRSALQSIGVSIWSMYSGIAQSIMRVFMAKVVFVWIGVMALYLAEPVCWMGSLLFTIVPYYVYQRKRFPSVKKCNG